MSTAPSWATPAGFLFTATENVSTALALVATGPEVSTEVLIGSLPAGLELSINGDITGTPGPVQSKTRNRFTARASNSYGVADRVFFIDVEGKTSPSFTVTNVTTSNGKVYLNVGPNGESWALNRQFVNFSLGATADPALTPEGTRFKFYIGDNSGQLPPGLNLNTEGVISGFLTDDLSLGTGISVPKTYDFSVTVTDGVANSEGNYSILVVNPDIIRNPATYLLGVDPGLLTVNTTYMPPLQFLKGTELGIIKAQNNIILDVSAYDPYPETPTVVYFLGTGTTLPPYLNMDYNTGRLYGYIPYQPAYTKNYNLEVIALRYQYFSDNVGPENPVIDTSTFTLTEITTFTSNVFSLSIQGDVDSVLEWVSTSSLGEIVIGEISELSVLARTIGGDFTINYRLVDGALPSGLIFRQDGSISGKVDYEESTGTYTIKVVASDAFALSEIKQTFTINVSRYNDKKYTEIYCRPFFSREKRNIYQEFISNKNIFDPNLMYRYFDPNFGVQSSIKMVLEFGIEQVNLEDYALALSENFYRRRLYFGEIKSAIAKDSNGNVVYEVVYVDIVDDQMTSDDRFPPQSFTLDNQTYYPGSIGNQQIKLGQILISPGEFIDVNEFMLPRYMRTAQPGDYRNLNYISVIPLCYTLPGNSSKVISRIRQSGFDFNQFDFDVDRIIVQTSLDQQSAKYLILSKQSINDN